MLKFIASILAALPTVHVGLDDLHLHVTVGEIGLGKASVGLTVGPRFLSLDVDGDIARQLVSPPEGYQAPMSDVSFDWNSREGLTYLNVPAVQYKARPFAWEIPRHQDEEEWDAEAVRADLVDKGLALPLDESEPVTQRWERQPEAYTVQ